MAQRVNARLETIRRHYDAATVEEEWAERRGTVRDIIDVDPQDQP